MRRVDWKASASSGRLQVRVFEPSIALECFLFLDLNQENYPQRGRIDASELAIVIAASLAGWITSKRQAVGLLVNGKDPLGEYGQPLPLPPEKGQAHLMRLLEVMARVELAEALPLAGLIQQQRFHLAWGSSLIVISGQASEELLDELYKARQAGQNALLVIAGPSPDNPQMTRRAAQFGIQMICITNERDLEPWRR